MTKDKRPKEKPSSPLAPDDAELWRRVAGTAEPLRKGKNRAVDIPEPPAAEPPDPPRSEKPSSGPAPHQPSPPPQPRTPPLGRYDRREARGLASGRVGIDARIDLHGMRQREAHAALKGFLARCQDRGHRHVLVITGKGGARLSDAAPGRGVLNREVPRWLSEPEFRQMVVSHTPANKRHGGEGALYVRLRKDSNFD